MRTVCLNTVVVAALNVEGRSWARLDIGNCCNARSCTAGWVAVGENGRSVQPPLGGG